MNNSEDVKLEPEKLAIKCLGLILTDPCRCLDGCALCDGTGHVYSGAGMIVIQNIKNLILTERSLREAAEKDLKYFRYEEPKKLRAEYEKEIKAIEERAEVAEKRVKELEENLNKTVCVWCGHAGKKRILLYERYRKMASVK